MSNAEHPAAARGPWRDADGNLIALQSRVEQVVVNANHGALWDRLHQQGQVVGRGTHLIYVCFDRGNQFIALHPHHVRVIDDGDAAAESGDAR
jgi:hypothetical protein